MATSKKASRVRAQLRNAQQKKLIVQFARPFESGTLAGYVIDVGPKFFLLAVLSEGFEFENYTFLRIADVRALECPAKRSKFYAAARRIRGDKMPPKLRANLADGVSIVDSIHDSLVTVHRERVSPGTCRIGYVLSRNTTALELLEIDPDAKWESQPTYIRLNQITRIDLPGPYERALLSVGGEPQLPPVIPFMTASPS